MQVQETIFCATAALPGSSTGPGAVYIHDIQTGNSLASFKQTNAGTHCTAVVESVDSQGGFFLAAQPEKSLMNVYNFQKDQMSLKIVLPENLTCIQLDRNGTFAAGGSVSGRIFLWEVSSGILFNAWDAHYREVTALHFTQDGAALISGSKDSGISVWSVSRLLDDDLQNDLALPYCTFSDHTLAITDIVCGIGSFPSCRLLTASIDHSVKLWDLSSKSLLTTFQFPKPISSLAWDLTERLFFAASEDGSIHQMNLFRNREDKTHGRQLEAIGGAGVSDPVRLEEESTMPSNKRLISVGHGITCLSISLTSSLLLVGTSSGLINIYDIASHQVLRTISTHKGFSITYLKSMLKPPDLIGHISLGLSLGSSSDTRDVIPVKPVLPFIRMRDPKSRTQHEVSLLLPARGSHHIEEDMFYTKSSFLRDHEIFVGPSSLRSITVEDASSLRTRVTDLEAEVQQLREHLGKAKSINDTMWNNVVQRVVGQVKPTPSDVTPERPHKRGRANS